MAALALTSELSQATEGYQEPQGWNLGSLIEGSNDLVHGNEEVCDTPIGPLGEGILCESKRNQINRLFSSYDSENWGASLMISQGDAVLMNESFGTADRRSGAEVTSQTNFRLASASKPFTAIAVMRLKELGLLGERGLDTPVSEVFPEWRDSNTTIRHLLRHRARLPEYYNIAGGEFDDDRAFEVVRSQVSGNVSVGSYRYSNSGYVILGRIVEELSGIPYEDFVQQEVFARAGMTSSTFRAGDGFVANSAYGYPRDRSGASEVMGDGGVYSNSEDMYRFFQAFVNNEILSEDSRRQVEQGDGYGFGWRIRHHGALGRFYNHSGHSAGANTLIARYPEAPGGPISISILTNRRDRGNNSVEKFPSRAAAQIADILSAPGC